LTGFRILVDDNKFAKDEAPLVLDNLASIVKRSTGKINIKMRGKPALALDFRVNKLSLDIIDPTVLSISKHESNDLGLLEKLKVAGKVSNLLNDMGLSIFILRKGKKALSLGREATPILSSLLTGSDEIQIDSIRQVAKLERDIKKLTQNKE
jgi:hypothetical protein